MCALKKQSSYSVCMNLSLLAYIATLVQDSVFCLSCFSTEMLSDEKGILYFSCIPDGVTPTNIQVFLASEFGEVGRLYLTPQNDTSSFASRDHYSKHKKRYKDGYIEFMNKEDAIHAADQLNMKTCSFLGKRHKSSGQLWNVRFIPKLRWESILEKRESERISREQRLKQRKKLLRNRNTEYYAKALKRMRDAK